MNAPDRAKVEALKAAWAEDRQARVQWWRDHWFLELWEVFRDFGGATMLGVGFGLAAVIYVLQELAK